MENHSLKSGSKLQNGKYRILDVLGQGGFGITYLAEQTGLGMKVAIKEFFMKGSCQRDTLTSKVSVPVLDNEVLVGRCLKKFKSEARKIASLNNDHIVNIIDVFDENGTSYYVMKHLGGGSLADKIKYGPLQERESLRIIREIADALKSVHGNGLLHLDIKPANILFDERGRAVLIDFGVSKYVDSQQDSTATSSLVGFSRGYAPLEQVNATISSLSPPTDIYALGGTLYSLVTGAVPPDASDIMEQGSLSGLPEGLDSDIVNAIEQSMRPRRSDRPQDIDAFLSLLPEDSVPAPQPVEEEEVDEGVDTTVIAVPAIRNEASVAPPASSRTGKIMIVIASFMMLASIALAAISFLRPKSPVDNTQQTALLDSLNVLQNQMDSISSNAADVSVIEKLQSENASLRSRISSLEREVSNWKQQASSYKSQADKNKADAEKYRRSLNVH